MLLTSSEAACYIWHTGPSKREILEDSEEQFRVAFREAPLLFSYRLTDCDNVKMQLHLELSNQARHLWALPNGQQQNLFGSP